jgi:predicted nucleotidyltransferase component of viral defense system
VQGDGKHVLSYTLEPLTRANHMIGKAEIEAQAECIGVHHANVERDYVFGWLLKTFYDSDYLAPLLVFKGGNCMRKGYYGETRFSNDLDFW